MKVLLWKELLEQWRSYRMLAVAAVLGRRFRTLRTPGNMNNEIGLPLALLDLDAEHEAAVLEMGMYVGGEIATLAAIARPRVGVVTAPDYAIAPASDLLGRPLVSPGASSSPGHLGWGA